MSFVWLPEGHQAFESRPITVLQAVTNYGANSAAGGSLSGERGCVLASI